MSIIRFLALGALGTLGGFLALGVFLTGAGPAVAAELRVRVTQLRAGDGGVHFALYSTAEAFPHNADRYAGAAVHATDRRAAAAVAGRGAGRCACAVSRADGADG